MASSPIPNAYAVPTDIGPSTRSRRVDGVRRRLISGLLFGLAATVGGVTAVATVGVFLIVLQPSPGQSLRGAVAGMIWVGILGSLTTALWRWASELRRPRELDTVGVDRDAARQILARYQREPGPTIRPIVEPLRELNLEELVSEFDRIDGVGNSDRLPDLLDAIQSHPSWAEEIGDSGS